MAYVRVRRRGRRAVVKGKGEAESGEAGEGWISLNDHLWVRDTREDDPEAELMVSAVVPRTDLVSLPPTAIDVEPRPRECEEVFSAPPEVMRRMDPNLLRFRLYRASLADKDRVAVLGCRSSTVAASRGNVIGSEIPLDCPPTVARDRREIFALPVIPEGLPEPCPGWLPWNGWHAVAETVSWIAPSSSCSRASVRCIAWSW